MSWSSGEKKECSFWKISKEIFLNIFFISMQNALNELSEYIYFYISKNITLHNLVDCF